MWQKQRAAWKRPQGKQGTGAYSQGGVFYNDGRIPWLPKGFIDRPKRTGQLNANELARNEIRHQRNFHLGQRDAKGRFISTGREDVSRRSGGRSRKDARVVNKGVPIVLLESRKLASPAPACSIASTAACHSAESCSFFGSFRMYSRASASVTSGLPFGTGTGVSNRVFQDVGCCLKLPSLVCAPATVHQGHPTEASARATRAMIAIAISVRLPILVKGGSPGSAKVALLVHQMGS